MSEDTQGVTINDPAAVLAALDRAKADAKRYREELEAKDAVITDLTEKVTRLEGDDGIAAYKKRIIDLQIARELEKEGVKNSDRVSKFLNREGIDLDADGNMTGFKESLETVKKDLPELFDPKRSVGGKADLFANQEAKSNKTSTELQVEKIFSGV